MVLGADRALLTVAHEREAVGSDALGDQIIDRGLGATLAECEVVLVRAALVAVTLDEHERVAVRAQPRRARLERLGGVEADVRLVVIEVDVGQPGDVSEVLRRGKRAGRGNRGLRRRRGRGGGRLL